MEIKGQVIAITGVSAGIGATTARLLAARGARVVLGARREDALGRIVAEIEADGGRATACVADVTRPEDLSRLVAVAVEQFGRLDALVANAGVAHVAPLAEGKLSDWDTMVDVNLRGVLHGIAAALEWDQKWAREMQGRFMRGLRIGELAARTREGRQLEGEKPLWRQRGVRTARLVPDSRGSVGRDGAAREEGPGPLDVRSVGPLMGCAELLGHRGHEPLQPARRGVVGGGQ